MGFSARIVFALIVLGVPLAAQSQAQEIPSQEIPAQNLLPDKPAPRTDFLTRPFRDKHVLLLAEMNAGAAAWDDIASRMVIDRGGFERNPLMRPFVHNSAALAAETVGEVWLMAYVGDWMKHSHNHILRKAWWVPQTLDITAKMYGGGNNTAILSRR